MKIKYVKVNPKAHAPTRAHSSDAGYDLYSTEYLKIEPFERTLVSTGLIIEIPDGFYGRIAPRSGLACKKGIDVMAGVIDSGYRGEIKVLLINLNFAGYNITPNTYDAMFGSTNKMEINPGDRIAQLIIEKCHSVEWDQVNDLSLSPREDGGFGSSGQ